MKLPKQLQPSQQELQDSCSCTRAVSFLSHTFRFCSASLQSSCIYLMWNWAEQRHDVKTVVWWAWWKVESFPRWPLSGGGWGGGVERLWRRNGLVSLWPDMLSRGNEIISMVKTAQFQFILGGFFFFFFFFSMLELKVDMGILFR